MNKLGIGIILSLSLSACVIPSGYYGDYGAAIRQNALIYQDVENRKRTHQVIDERRSNMRNQWNQDVDRWNNGFPRK